MANVLNEAFRDYLYGIARDCKGGADHQARLEGIAGFYETKIYLTTNQFADVAHNAQFQRKKMMAYPHGEPNAPVSMPKFEVRPDILDVDPDNSAAARAKSVLDDLRQRKTILDPAATPTNVEYSLNDLVVAIHGLTAAIQGSY